MERIYAPPKEVIEIIKTDNPNLAIGGTIDHEKQVITLIPNIGADLIIPFSIFTESGTTKPDFTKTSIIDYGQTLKLGEYEASILAIIEEMKS